MIIKSTMQFICANAKDKKDGGKYCTSTFMSENETMQFPLTEDCYNYLLNKKAAPLTNVQVAIELGAYEGSKTYRIVGVAL